MAFYLCIPPYRGVFDISKLVIFDLYIYILFVYIILKGDIMPENELIKRLNFMKDVFMDAFAAAPLYGGYSRTLKTKIASKQQVRNDFIENIRMFGAVNPSIKDEVNAVLKEFENMG